MELMKRSLRNKFLHFVPNSSRRSPSFPQSQRIPMPWLQLRKKNCLRWPVRLVPGLITRRVKHLTAKNKRSNVLSASLNVKSAKGRRKKNVLV